MCYINLQTQLILKYPKTEHTCLPNHQKTSMYFSFHFQHHYSFCLLYPKNGFQNNDLGICRVHLIFPVKKKNTHTNINTCFMGK